MEFRTKLDFSRRQVKQNPKIYANLSGATTFGVPFSAMTSGPDLSKTGETAYYITFNSSFSGNSATTVYNWAYPVMSSAEYQLSALTPSNSAITQNVLSFSSTSSTVIDGNTVNLSYSGLSFDITPIILNDLGSGNYSGTVYTELLQLLTAEPLDFTGRTIWVDVSGMTRTDKLIVTNNPSIGKVLACVDSEGMAEWQTLSGLTALTSIWSAGTGTPSAALINGDSIASGNFSVAAGRETIASNNNSFATGLGTIASGIHSFVGGYYSNAIGFASTALGSSTASGYASTALGINSFAVGAASTSLGLASTAYTNYSFAGGINSFAIGERSFVFGSGSTVTGDDSFVFGKNISGTSNDYVYVPSLNIKAVGAGPGVTDIGIDALGNVVDQASDISLKENIKTIQSALEKVLKLRGVTYNWINKEKGGDATKLGFIAQEVNQVIPELTYNNSGYMGVHYKDISALLVEAIKELSQNKSIINSNQIETETIVAEDNNIDLNYNGDHQSSIGGGLTVLNGVSENENTELKTDENGDWLTNVNFIPKGLIIPNYTPESSNSEGKIGSITYDDNFIYIKTKNGWKRTSLESF